MTIVLSGASKGIGFALAEQFLQAGNTVYGSSRKEHAQGLLTLQDRYPSLFFPFVLDLADKTSIHDAKEHLTSRCSAIDILVNSAGVYLDHALNSFEDIDSDAILETFTCNALGSFRFTQALYPLLRTAASSKVFTISSIIGSIAFHRAPHEYAYTTSKAALNMLTRLMQLQLKQDSIAVCAIHPGWVKTNMGGPQAPLSPEQSAQGLYTQMLNWNNTDHPFIDYTGKAIAW